MWRNIALSHQSETIMLGTFTSSHDGVKGTNLPFHFKQLEDQIKYTEKNSFQTLDCVRLDR